MTETIFISGADKGLGFALAARFLQAGFRVFGGVYRSPSSLLVLQEKFPKMLTAVPLDVSAMDSVRAAAENVAQQVSALDVLINNAGINLERESVTLEELDLADQRLEKTMAVNAFGPLRVAQQFLPLLRQGKRKLIINISSEAGGITDSGRQQEFAYCMSKSALNMQSKLLQNYLGPQGFKVLALHPGWMRTDMGGPQAAISADQSAEGIFALASRDWSPDDPIYMDYLGKALRW
jgi:NAD(P)-dependent dehydrogenase (short-subunit alcohol dehydrogenase family)